MKKIKTSGGIFWLTLYMYTVWIYIWHLCPRFTHYERKQTRDWSMR